MEFLLLLLVGFIVWHFIPQRNSNQPAPRFRTETRADKSDPEWSSYIEEHCESPAETAFLRAMIKAYDLEPDEGTLSGKGLRLDFQVEEGRYRTDFLADRWLVVEIDGAAYHSSPEAIERDKARDTYFEGLGYSVLRIPAKVVFNTPEEAVRRVQSALRMGRKSHPVQVQKSGLQRLSETMLSISNEASEIGERARRIAAVQLALKDVKAAFDEEKTVIEVAVERSKNKLQLDEFLSEDEHLRALFEKNHAKLIRSMTDDSGEVQPRAANTLNVRQFPAAPPHCEDAEHSAAIQAEYSSIAEARDAFLEAQRLNIESDPQLPALVQKELEKSGWGGVWNLLATAQR